VPHFRRSTPTAWTRADADSKAFQESVLLAASARVIWFAPPDTELKDGVPIYETKKKEMMELMEKSLAAAEKVPDAFLDRLHPYLKMYYRQNMMAGQKFALRALRDSVHNQSMEDSAEGGMLTWAKFWEKNQNRILKKLP
jgi:hypothetical protein